VLIFSSFKSRTRSKALHTLGLYLFFISLLFPFIAHSDQVNTNDKNITNYKLLVLGDSLAAAYGLTAEQGWVHLLQEHWNKEQQSIEVVNAAISGDTTDGGLARLPRLLNMHQPTHLYIELGGNNGLQGHNPSKIKDNLAKMIEMAQGLDIEVILQEIQIPTNYGRRYTELFTQNYHQLAAEYEVPLIPFFLQDIALDSSLMQNDGIHPTAEAQPMIVDFLAPKLTPLIVAIKPTEVTENNTGS
jgi:acyl-CoA thioesterase-1